jgi:hypothetical protein
MTLKDRIRIVLREHYGEFNTYLEHEYENKITENLMLGNTEEKQAWATYNQVILEFKNSLKDTTKVKELQYKLTEDSDPNEVCIQIIEDLENRSPELERLYHKILNF